MQMKTRGARVAAMAVTLALVAACGGNGGDSQGSPPDAPQATGVREAPPAESSKPVPGGTMTVGLEAETNSWLPSETRPGSAGLTVWTAIYDPLVVRTLDGSIEPYLAESVTPNENFTRWTLALRDGVSFHDGTPLNADAMKRMFDDYLVAEGSVAAGFFAGVQMEVTGSLTVDYVLAEPNATFLDNLLGLGGYPFSPTAADAAGADAGSRPVGTGPFTFESWVRDGELRVVRNEQYWRTDADGTPLPYLDEIIFRPIPDGATRLDSLRSGDVDLIQTLDTALVRSARDLVDTEGFKSYEWLGNSSGGILFNTLGPPFDDVRVRLAIAHATDADQVLEVQGGAGITPVRTQFFSEDSPWYSDAAAAAWPTYDVERATELSDAYVNDPDRSDGKGVGERISFTYSCVSTPEQRELGQLLQALWQQTGFQVELDFVEQSALIAKAAGTDNQPPLRGDFDAQCWRLGGNQDPYPLWAAEYGPIDAEVRNTTDFTHPKITAAVDSLRSEDDVNARKQLVEEISLLLAEQVPNIWLGGTAAAIVADASVRGVQDATSPDGTSMDSTTSAIVWTPFLWIEETA